MKIAFELDVNGIMVHVEANSAAEMDELPENMEKLIAWIFKRTKKQIT